MEASLLQWLSCLAFAAIILALLMYNLYRHDNALAWIVMGYFWVCLSLIAAKWFLRRARRSRSRHPSAARWPRRKTATFRYRDPG